MDDDWGEIPPEFRYGPIPYQVRVRINGQCDDMNALDSCHFQRTARLSEITLQAIRRVDVTESLATLQHQIAMQTKRERGARKLQKAICNAVCYDDDFAKAWLFGESDYQNICISLGLDPIWLSDALKEALALAPNKRYLTLVHKVEPCYNDICPYETDPNSNGTSPTKKM